MKMLSMVSLAGACLLAAHAWAGELAGPADLPPTEAVRKALDSLPAVQAAQAELRAAAAERDRLGAGEHEFNLSLTGQRRKVAGEANYREWNVGLERGVRLPGKAGLDTQAGEQGVLAATEKVSDARHEGARQLLSLWYAARQAGLEAALWRNQAALLAEQKRIVEIRVKRGDSARLELLQAEAALSQAEAMTVAAESRASLALADLKSRYPDLPPPGDMVAVPQMPEGDVAAWRARMLEHNHELMAASHELEKAKLLGRRAEANRIPDPTLGLYVANEQGGRDKIMGVSVSFALPGTARSAQARMQQAAVDVQAEKLRAVQIRLEAEAVANWQRAQSGVESWRRQHDAALAIDRHAELAKRAYELGEIGLSDSLLARRAALDAALADGQARLSGNEATARLLLDSHQLWPLEAEENAH